MADERLAQIEILLTRAETHIADVFRAAIYGLRDQLDLNEVADLLMRGDYQRLIDMFEDVSRNLGTAAQTVFVQSGQEATGYIRDAAHVAVSFDQVNVAAVTVMQDTTLRLIREFTDQQRLTLQHVMSRGIVAGLNPIEQARQFRDSVGLTAYQEQTVTNYRAKLEAVGNGNIKQSIQRLALELKLRDGRGDAQINRAIRDNTPLSQEKIDWLVGRYRERAIKARAENIARTEALAAVHEGDKAAFDQAIQRGKIRPEDIEETWVAVKDARTRDSHRMLDQQKHPYGELWQGLYGTLRFPGDPEAPAAERINCRCVVVRRIRRIGHNNPP